MKINRYFKDKKIDRCYCSPLKRCRKSFELLALNCQCVYDDDLREIDFGSWEGLSFEQINRKDKEHVALWTKCGDQFVFPDGEAIIDFKRRVAGWIDRILRLGDDTLLVVSHAGVIRAAICHLLNIDSNGFYRFDIREGGISLVTHSQGFSRLSLLNGGGNEHG